MKLIKYDYAKPTIHGTDGEYERAYSYSDINKVENSLSEIGTYKCNSLNETSRSNTWSESRLNTTNLNINIINNMPNKS